MRLILTTFSNYRPSKILAIENIVVLYYQINIADMNILMNYKTRAIYLLLNIVLIFVLNCYLLYCNSLHY